MAVAQAQHTIKEVSDLLQEKGIDVKYGIHPVAGRMPGHMNVLLAEANVPYDQLWEMEKINPIFPETDVVIVVGANDVTNPAARTKPDSPLYGMPIMNVDKAKTVVFIKRSMSPGFSGSDNELFYLPNTWMVFGDAKKVLSDLVGRAEKVLRDVLVRSLLPSRYVGEPQFGQNFCPSTSADPLLRTLAPSLRPAPLVETEAHRLTLP